MIKALSSSLQMAQAQDGCWHIHWCGGWSRCLLLLLLSIVVVLILGVLVVRRRKGACKQKRDTKKRGNLYSNNYVMQVKVKSAQTHYNNVHMYKEVYRQ